MAEEYEVQPRRRIAIIIVTDDDDRENEGEP